MSLAQKKQQLRELQLCLTSVEGQEFDKLFEQFQSLQSEINLLEQSVNQPSSIFGSLQKSLTLQTPQTMQRCEPDDSITSQLRMSIVQKNKELTEYQDLLERVEGQDFEKIFSQTVALKQDISSLENNVALFESSKECSQKTTTTDAKSDLNSSIPSQIEQIHLQKPKQNAWNLPEYSSQDNDYYSQKQPYHQMRDLSESKNDQFPNSMSKITPNGCQESEIDQGIEEILDQINGLKLSVAQNFDEYPAAESDQNRLHGLQSSIKENQSKIEELEELLDKKLKLLESQIPQQQSSINGKRRHNEQPSNIVSQIDQLQRNGVSPLPAPSQDSNNFRIANNNNGQFIQSGTPTINPYNNINNNNQMQQSIQSQIPNTNGNLQLTQFGQHTVTLSRISSDKKIVINQPIGELRRLFFTEDYDHVNYISYIKYSLDPAVQIKKTIFSFQKDFIKNKSVKGEQIHAEIAKIFNNSQGFCALTDNEQNYLKHFVSVIKQYLSLRGLKICGVENEIRSEGKLKRYDLMAESDKEILIFDWKTTDANAQYKILVDYEEHFLQQLRVAQQRYPSKQIRICILPIYNMDPINLIEFEYKDILKIQKDQAQNAVFQKSMIKIFYSDVIYKPAIQDEWFLNDKGIQRSISDYINHIITNKNIAEIEEFINLDNAQNYQFKYDDQKNSYQRRIDKDQKNFRQFYYIHILICFKLNNRCTVQLSDASIQRMNKTMQDLNQQCNFNLISIDSNNNSNQVNLANQAGGLFPEQQLFNPQNRIPIPQSIPQPPLQQFQQNYNNRYYPNSNYRRYNNGYYQNRNYQQQQQYPQYNRQYYQRNYSRDQYRPQKQYKQAYYCNSDSDDSFEDYSSDSYNDFQPYKKRYY